MFDTLLDRLIPSDRVSQLAVQDLSARLPFDTDPGEILHSRLRYERRKESLGQEWTVSSWLDDWANTKGHDPAIVRSAGRQAELAAETISLTLTDEAREFRLTAGAGQMGHDF